MILQEYKPSKFFTAAVSFAVHNFSPLGARGL